VVSNKPNKNIFLLIGGLFSLAFAIFQVSAIFWSSSLVRYFGGPLKMQLENPFMFICVCVLLGAIIAISGLYALSGVGKIRYLPFLRTMLTAITLVYILRGLAVVNDLRIIYEHPDLNLIRFAVFSYIALCIGIIHLIGVTLLFQQGRSKNSENINHHPNAA
jgi:hypothetical protein